MTETEVIEQNPFTRAGEDVPEAEWEDDRPDHPEPPLWMYDHSHEGNVIRFTRPHIDRCADATVIGDLTECDALLNMPVVVGTTDTAPRTFGSNWERHEQTWGEAIVNFLATHPEQAHKGGNALFFAEGQKTRTRRNGVDFCYKLEKKILNVRAVAADIDGGCTVEQVIPRIRERGLFAIIYTTHSHTTKGGVGSDRFRIILPLSAPFELGDRDANPEAWEARKAEWQSRYFGLLETLIPEGGEIDSRGRLPSQMMHAPARPTGADFKHYILAGRGVTLDDMPAGDVSKYTRRAPSGAKGGSGGAQVEPAFLSDGFDLLAWASDHGEYFDLPAFLEMIGWDVRGDAGRGVDILCPNAGAHTSGEDTAWAAPGDGAGETAIIYCHHDHCSGLYTCDFLRLIEEQTDMPDGESFSALLCDPMFYPSEVDGEEIAVSREDYVAEEIKIDWLKTPAAVGRAFRALPANAGADHFAAIYAGICKAGEGGRAVAKWGELAKGHLDANRRKAAEKRGRDMLSEEKAARAAEKAEERHASYADALEGDPDNVSLDPAEPLGDDIETALATLGHRYAPCDLGGAFRIVRKPDLNAFNSDFDSTIAVYRKEDFLNLHLDRQIMEGDKLVNPAQTFLETAKRKSGLVFAPPPTVPGENDFNMYQGRKLKGVPGRYGDERDFPVLYDFLLRIVCDGSEEKLDWLLLWMAHLVQRPGEKPGTGIIGIGKGGIGKGRFGALLSKLAAPHFKQLENEAHVTGQFAGEHISKCVLVQVPEAVFGANPKVSSALKSMLDSTTIPVEVKGYSLIIMPSFARFYFDSNEAVPVLIEMNGSERRYFVLLFSSAEKGNSEFFADLTAAIEGEEMAMLVAYLERYVPALAGFTWSDVRTAPETPERRVMGWHSMRPGERRLLNVLRDTEVTLRVDGCDETFSAGKDGLRVPVAAFRSYIEAAGNKHNAEGSDVVGMVKRLLGVEITEKRGRCGERGGRRYWLFPPAVLGGDVDKILLGDDPEG
ncbi:primase-helicase family protein [uncultured Roseovarius sp.]|uniref:primase-helicase family protein n=1 Tax=uncultured Roseovarius sp. TaxID=293344 RepID=UPI00259543C7|nr:primase-helicase family protein [uncultured Roseovarius sp.]